MKLTERLEEVTCRSASMTILVKELEKSYRVSPHKDHSGSSGAIDRFRDNTLPFSSTDLLRVHYTILPIPIFIFNADQFSHMINLFTSTLIYGLGIKMPIRK